MSRTFHLLVIAACGLAAVLGLPPGARADEAPPAAAPTRLAEGIWVSVKGEIDPDGALDAETIEPLEGREMSIRATLDAWDPASGTLAIHPLSFVLDDASRLVGESDEPLERGDLARGDLVKVTFEAAPDGSLRVDKVRRRKGASENVRVEGPVEDIASGRRGATFRLLGLEIETDQDTEWTGLRHPIVLRLPDDDEDVRPDEHLVSGKAGFLSGEVRLDLRREGNYNLTDRVRDDLETARLRAQLEWTLPRTKHVSGMVEILPQAEWIVNDEARTQAGSEDVLLGEAWVLFSGVLGPHGSIQVGRSLWDDERDWWFRENLDSIRLAFDWRHARLEVALARQLHDPSSALRDASHRLVKATFYPARHHEVALVLLDRNDWHRFASGTPRDFEPQLVGVEAFGEVGRRWTYWLEAAGVRGHDRGDALRGHALDLGFTARLPSRWQPTLAAGWALGTGDENPDDDVVNDFRQSGLEDNNGKWNGLTNFRYYGEVMRPELSNLRIRTLGLGVRPTDGLSIDVAWHDYRLDEPASELVSADVGEIRRLVVGELEVGSEWDVVVAYEGLDGWEFELDLGRFSPGPAFRGDKSAATGAFLKAKWLF